MYMYMYITTVNREYFVPKIFHAIIFRVIFFRQTTLYHIIVNIAHVYIFVRLIFAQARLSENIFNNEIFAIYGTRKKLFSINFT